jgi:dUTP pyrophosphatase
MSQPDRLPIPVELLSPTAFVPTRATKGSVGLDLYSDEAGTLPPGHVRAVKTGVALAVPEGFVGLVVGRSGLATRGIVCHLGTIDQDFRGEVCVILRNEGPEPYHVGIGDRVAQLLLLPAPAFDPEPVEALEATARGQAGFGSSGI